MAAYSDDNSVKMRFGYVRVCGRVTVIPVEVRRLAGGLGGGRRSVRCLQASMVSDGRNFFEKDV